MINELFGNNFDYFHLPSVGASGGIAVGWQRDVWLDTQQALGLFSVTLHLQPLNQPDNGGSWLTVVYGPTNDALKGDFLTELDWRG
jgi:hypothetical protein